MYLHTINSELSITRYSRLFPFPHWRKLTSANKHDSRPQTACVKVQRSGHGSDLPSRSSRRCYRYAKDANQVTHVTPAQFTPIRGMSNTSERQQQQAGTTRANARTTVPRIASVTARRPDNGRFTHRRRGLAPVDARKISQKAGWRAERLLKPGHQIPAHKSNGGAQTRRR